MAAAGDRRAGCEGCGRRVALEELTTVTMPNGEQVACCPACEPHARRAADACVSLGQRYASCNGCMGEFLEENLEEVTLTDGTVVTCCPSCADEVPRGDDRSEGTADAGKEQNRCSQCTERVDEELFRVTTIDDRSEQLCSSCKAAAADEGILKTVEMRRARAREVLGVDADATDREIRAAYHEQVKRAHPDRPSGSRSAFQLVNGAYDRLRDEGE